MKAYEVVLLSHEQISFRKNIYTKRKSL